MRGEEIDRDTLRSHYAMSGFDPAQAIQARLKAQARALVGEFTPAPLAFGGGAVLFALAAWALARNIESEAWLSHLAFFGMGLLLVSVVLAASYRWQMRGRAMAILIPVPVLVFAAVATNVAPSPRAMVNSLPSRTSSSPWRCMGHDGPAPRSSFGTCATSAPLAHSSDDG